MVLRRRALFLGSPLRKGPTLGADPVSVSLRGCASSSQVDNFPPAARAVSTSASSSPTPSPAILNPNYVEWFRNERTKTLHDLKLNLNDHSLAGRVDPRIEELVSFINNQERYFTLSSCSGRIQLFHRSAPVGSHGSAFLEPAPYSSPSSEGTTDHSSFPTEPNEGPRGKGAVAKAKAKRGFGKGTLWSTHDPLDEDSLHKVAQLVEQHVSQLQSEAKSRHRSPSTNSVADQQQLMDILELKFEPMVLHIRCLSECDADVLMLAASESGQRKSGFWRSPLDIPWPRLPSSSSSQLAINTDKHERATPSPQIESPSQGALSYRISCSIGSYLTFASPLLIGSTLTGPSTAPAVLPLLRYGNSLFEENFQRTLRFQSALQNHLTNR